jgi:hypothetical protein
MAIIVTSTPMVIDAETTRVRFFSCGVVALVRYQKSTRFHGTGFLIFGRNSGDICAWSCGWRNAAGKSRKVSFGSGHEMTSQ